MATLLDDRERGQQWAREVRTACLEELEQLTAKGEDAYWTLATLGEAALILEDDDEAADWYRRAAQAGSDRYGDLGSTRRNARLLLRHLRGDTSQIDRLLPVPRLAVLAGRPTAQASLPADRHEALREEVESRLVGANALIGYSSAGTEMDVLFSEALLAAGGEVHIVLPYDKDDFVRDTLETASDAEFGARLEAIVQCAAEIVTASQGKLEGGRVALDYADLMLFGLARLRALQLETDLIPFAFSSGSLEGDGVAAQLVRRWTSDGCPPEVIDLQGTPEAAAPPAAPMPPQTGFAGRILAILFADTVSFSRLTDVAVRRFVEYFLGAIAGLTTGDSFTPLAMNTWGDGLFGIFRSVREAGEYALALTELVTATDWESKGLPADLNVRIALHAGPVWSYTNPVTGKSDYIGTHVTRAARLEPITPPGNVYATYGFASLAAAEGVEGFACEYVGETPLAKSAGMCPTYHVRRRRG
jgi:class 3 adenylate cyclase